MPTIVLTAIGDDQSGLVDALSGVIAKHGASWDRSHMSHLAGKFAGIVEVSVPAGKIDALLADLGPLEEKGLLDITASTAAAVAVLLGESPDRRSKQARLKGTRPASLRRATSWERNAS